jgi:hypothetical protein
VAEAAARIADLTGLERGPTQVRQFLTLQRHLAHGLLYMPLRDVVIAHSSRPPWDLLLPWEFPSLTCQPL